MKQIFIYSEEGCPHCIELKDSLNNLGIEFIGKEIDKNEKEWKKISTHTDVEYVPTVLIIDSINNSGRILAPDRDWDEIDECITLIQETLQD